MNTTSLQNHFGETWKVGSLNETWPKGEKLVLLAETLPSTSDEVDSWGKERVEGRDAICLVAKKQDSGHGRLGRPWFSPTGKTLTMTLFFKVPKSRPVGHWPLIIAWSQYRSLCSWVPNRELDIKWPNDLLISGRKVGGSLCSARNLLGETWLSVGIGINLGPMVFPEPLKNQATSLHEHLKDSAPSLEQLLAAVVDSLIEDAKQISPEDLISNVRSACSWQQNCDIAWNNQTGEQFGTTAGIAPNGALVVKQAGQLQELNVSEIFQVRKRD